MPKAKRAKAPKSPEQAKPPRRTGQLALKRVRLKPSLHRKGLIPPDCDPKVW